MCLLRKKFPANEAVAAVNLQYINSTVKTGTHAGLKALHDKECKDAARIADTGRTGSTELSMNRNEALFSSMFENSATGIAIGSREGKLINANPRLCEMLGYTKEELLEMTFGQLTFPCDIDECIELYNQVMNAERVSFEKEKRYVRKDGSVFWGLLTISAVKDAGGKPYGTVAMVKDISRRKAAETALEASQDRFRSFITQAPTAIAMFDKELRFMMASKRWFTDYNLEPALTEGKTMSELFPLVTEYGSEVLRKCLAGETFRIPELKLVLNEERYIYVKLEIKPSEDLQGNVNGLLIFTEDISEDRRQREEIMKLNSELQELNSQKSRLFSVIAHDLKNPVGACNELLKMLASKKDTIKQEEFSGYITVLSKSAERVFNLMEELLAWSSVQMNYMVFEPVQLNTAREAAIILERMRSPLEEKNISVELDIDPGLKVNADKEMLRIILRNLLSNAIKFSWPGGKISLHAAAADKGVLFSLKDNGVGISSEHLKQLFNGSPNISTYGTSGEKGTGIGLGLCYEFTRQHHGWINASSEPGKGSVFTFFLPSERVPA